MSTGFSLELTPVSDLGKLGGSNFLQSRFWAVHKSRFGWQPYGFCCTWNESPEPLYLLVLVRQFRLGLALAYVPHGPDAVQWRPCFLSAEKAGLTPGQVLQALGTQLAAFLPKGVFCVRFDPNWPQDFLISHDPGALLSSTPLSSTPLSGQGEQLSASMSAHAYSLDLSPLKKAGFDVQPPDTVLVDLRPDKGDILSSMKSKHRYNIRLAQKKGVNIQVFSLDNEDFFPELDHWYQLYGETARRDGITIHSRNYYRNVFQAAQASHEVKVYLLQAFHEQDYIAGIIIALTPKRATYVYGASSNLKRNLMPAYALQWRAMELAKEQGAVEYDLFGIPPTSDPNHPMFGLYQFKTGFGGRKVHYPGSWDHRTRLFMYFFYTWAEKIRKIGIILRKKK